MEVKSPNFCVTAYPVKSGFNHICLFWYAPYWFVPVIAYKQVVPVFKKLNLEHICHTGASSGGPIQPKLCYMQMEQGEKL